MHVGPPGPRDPDDLFRRLSDLAQASRTDDGRTLVQALIDQLAAGQTETLYSLHSAASALRQRGTEMEQTAESLRGYLQTALGELVEELTTAALATARRTVEGLREELSAEALRTTTALTTAIEQSRAQVEHADSVVAGTLTQFTQGAEAMQERLALATEAAITQLRAAVTSSLGEVEARGADLEDRIVAASERAAELVKATAETLAHGLTVTAEAVEARFEASAMAANARAAELEARLAAAGAQAAEGLARSSASLANDVDHAGEGISAVTTAAIARVEQTTATTEKRLQLVQEGFGADVEATAQGLTAVGENILDRLILVLDERDRRDALLENRLTARVDRLTKKTADQVAELTTVLDEHLAAVRERDVAEREHIADAIRATVERLLAEPRGKLKKVRDDMKDDER